jgi:site-specific DNA recombinase
MAIIYARISTRQQSETSIADQLRVCRDYAAKNGLQITHEYSDDAICGAALGNRPGCQAALAALSAGDTLLLSDTTRLARSQELAPLITRLAHREVLVVGVLDCFRSDNRLASVQAGMSGLVSEEFRRNISERTHSALEMRAKDNRPTGGKCYGFNADGSVDELQAKFVREIFIRSAAGEAMRSIASDLNLRGVPSPGATWKRTVRRRDGRWLVSGIHSILKNERYSGRVVWNRSRWVRDPDSGKRQRRENPATEWIITDCESIVTRELFDRVRALAEPRRLVGGGAGGKPKFLLSGLLECAVCGAKLIIAGSGRQAYHCSTHRQGGAAACDMKLSAPRDVAETKILETIRHQLLTSAAVQHACQLIAGWERQDFALEQQPAGLAEIDARLARLRAQVDAGSLEPADIAPAVEAISAQRHALIKSNARRAGRKAGSNANAARKAYMQTAQNLRETLGGGP